MWANTNTTQAENDENVRVRGKENLVFFILFTGLRLWAKRTEYHCGNRRMKIAKREICESWRKHTASSWIYCRKSVSISLLSALFVFFLATPWLFLPISTQFTVCIRLHRLHTFLRLRLRLCPSPSSWSYCHYPCTAHNPPRPFIQQRPRLSLLLFVLLLLLLLVLGAVNKSIFRLLDAAVAFPSLPEVLNIERTTPEANANIFVFLSISSSYFHFVPRTSAALPHTRTHTLVFFFL